MAKIGAGYLLVVVVSALIVLLRRVDSAVRQMNVGEGPAGGALAFPVSLSEVSASLNGTSAQKSVDATRTAWRAYYGDVGRTDVFRDPFDVARDLLVLDVCLTLLGAALLAVVLRYLLRLNRDVMAALSPADERFQQGMRRTRMLQVAFVALGFFVAINVVEDWHLWRALLSGEPVALLFGGPAVGPLASLVKLPLLVAVLLPIAFVAATLALTSHPLRLAVASTRGVLYAVAALVLLLSFGMGANQADDVVRAWDRWHAVWAVLATAALAMTVAGVIRFMCDKARENHAPDIGDSVQPSLLWIGVVVMLIGAVAWSTGVGWGVLVAGSLLLLLWVLGVPIDGLRQSVLPLPVPAWIPRRWFPAWAVDRPRPPDGPGASVLAAVEEDRDRAVTLRADAIEAAARGDSATWRAKASEAVARADEAERKVARSQAVAADQEPAMRAAAEAAAEARPAARDALDAEDLSGVAPMGDRIGRVAGGAVAALLVVAIARAIALDTLVREDRGLGVVAAPLVAAIAIAVIGATLCTAPTRPVRLRFTPWVWCMVAALLMGIVALVDGAAIIWPSAAGTVAVLLSGFTVLLGALALSTGAIRRGPLTRYRLVPALRALRFSRFPVLPFLAAWAVVVSTLDSGGYHDIRRHDRPSAGTAPTIAQVWQQYLRAGTPGQPRPVVMVAAHGGGIRAAVWTALVMECVFGPGPVQRSEDVCAKGATPPTLPALAAAAREPLPMFLASGASGGSVGIAAWTARRADLATDGTASRTPMTIEQALGHDFVAPDVARLLVGDIPRAFLAWDRPDRAEMLERAWESPWQRGDTGPRGLARGLRDTWEATHLGSDWGTPVLALNSISVEDDCRFLASAVDFALPRQSTDPASLSLIASDDDRPNDAACRGIAKPDAEAVDILPSTNELIDYLCDNEDVPLSTAAHLSARFPYVSPTGRIERKVCDRGEGLVRRPAVSYTADGGFFDNAGAGTAVDTWRALAPLAAATERETGACVVPIFVQIDNSAPAATVSSAADPRPNEVTAPVNATLGQVGSRETYARAGAAAAFGPPVSAGGQPVQRRSGPAETLWFRIALHGQPGPEPPLGWTLAPKTVEDMRAQLRTTSNREQITALREMVSNGGLTCSPPSR
jgi:hypothetical protein